MCRSRSGVRHDRQLDSEMPLLSSLALGEIDQRLAEGLRERARLATKPSECRPPHKEEH